MAIILAAHVLQVASMNVSVHLVNCLEKIKSLTGMLLNIKFTAYQIISLF